MYMYTMYMHQHHVCSKPTMHEKLLDVLALPVLAKPPLLRDMVTLGLLDKVLKPAADPKPRPAGIMPENRYTKGE